MIDSDVYGKIRRLYIEGMPQRKISRELGVSRAAVAKYCKGGFIPASGGPRCRRDPEDKEDIKKAILTYLEKHDDDQESKQKINAHTVWRDLHYTYQRSESTYRRYMAEIYGERQTETRMPLMFQIAEAAEADWKMAKARIRGEKIDIHVLCVTLMYGYTPFMKAYPNEKQYNLIDGLVSAMDFFMGAPRKLIIDNATTVRKKGYGKNAELTDEFKLFAAHYGIGIEFTNPYEPEEKGGIEVSAKTAGGILTPVLDVGDISEVNDRLLTECMYYIGHTGCVGLRPRSVREMTNEEKPYLIPLPVKRYEVGVHDHAKVDNRQLLIFDEVTYSVPRPYAGKEIGVIAYAFNVEFYHKGQKIWECGRPILKNENRVYAEHYLYDLKIKPRSRENAFPLLEGVLPPPLHEFRKLCKSKTNKCYQLYMLMRKMEEVGRERLLKAIEIVNAAGNPTLEKVEAILAPNSPADGLDNKGPALDDDYYVEQRDPSGYDILWGR